MNKLGYYIENTTVPFLRDALRQVKPPVILIHAQDRGLLHEIRSQLAPDAFVIGRLYKENSVQDAWLDSSDPAARGREFAEEIIRYDFGMAKEKAANGRLLIDAWMSLNECLRGPASFPGYQVDNQFRQRAAAYDAFQAAFYDRLQSEGLVAVAFNFAAGNYTRPQDYLDWFPQTLQRYTYLGFHEYGWPSLKPGAGTATSALIYRSCMAAIRAQYGTRLRAIITEAGLTRAYGTTKSDEGWLNTTETISQDQYWAALSWYNDELVRDDYALGACLFQVGHAGRWISFRHLGQDNANQPILIVSKIEQLATGSPQPPPPPPPPNPPPQYGDKDTRLARLSLLINSLEQSRAMVDGLSTQTATLQNQLTPLSAALAGKPAATPTAQTLLDRLAVLEARLGSRSGPPIDALRIRIRQLQDQLRTLQPAVNQTDTTRTTLATLQRDVAAAAAETLAQAPLAGSLGTLVADTHTLQVKVGGLPGTGKVPQPPMADIRATLPRHPDPTKRYPLRTVEGLQQVIVHHTATAVTATPQAIAQGQIDRRDLPGITYHFTVDGRGTISWTQPLETVTAQTNSAAANLGGIAVALIGNFTDAPPVETQLNATAQLIAWLLSTYRIGTDKVVGRSELENTSSPGKQWLQEAQYKNTLLTKVEDILAAS